MGEWGTFVADDNMYGTDASRAEMEISIAL